jgi:hypothetical protein
MFAAICLYGVCIVRGANATYKVLQLHNYIAVRVSKERYAFVFYRRILRVAAELFAAKLAADVAVLLLAHEFSLAGFITALKLSFLLFIAAGVISCLIFGLFMLSVKPAIVTFISFVTLIAVQLINSASSAGGLIFAPVPKTFTSGSGIIILIKIAELVVAAAAVHAVSRSQYRNLSFMGGSHDKT